MKHPDGIEVYLKPAGKENENLRYAEYPVREDGSFADHLNTYNCRGMVLATKKPFTIVVQCDKSFGPHEASALLISTHTAQEVPKGATQCNRRVVQRSLMYEQSETKCFVYRYAPADSSTTNTDITKRLHMPSAAQGLCAETPRATACADFAALNGDFDKLNHPKLRREDRYDAIVVAVCLGKTTWIDEIKGKDCESTRSVSVIFPHGEATTDWDDSVYSTYGPGNPTEFRRTKLDCSFPIANPRGSWYIFEFRYRSQGNSSTSFH